LLLSGRLSSKIPDELILNKLEHFIRPSEFALYLPTPTEFTVSDDILLGLSRNDVTISYPLLLISLHSKYQYSNLYYLNRQGNNIISNNTSKLTKNNVIKKLDSVDKACIFVTNNLSRKVYEKGVTLLFKGAFDIIKQLYTGKVNKKRDIDIFNDIELVHTKNSVIINNEQDLLEHLTNTKRNYSNYVITNNGVFKVEYKDYVRKVKVTDFILNDDFEPVGLKILYEDNIYDIKVKKAVLEDLNIINKSVKVKVRYFLDKVIAIKFYRL